MNSKKLLTIALLSLMIISIANIESKASITAYTDDITISSVTITNTLETGYDAEAGLSFNFRLNNNYTTLKIYMCIKDVPTSANTVYTKIYTYSNYVNGTSGTSGLVSLSQSLYISENSFNSDFETDDPLYFYCYIYNSSISAANLIDSDTEAKTYPFSVEAEEEDEGYSLTTYAILLVFGVGAFVIAMFVIKFLKAKYESW